jgi:hypothetical protein
MTQERESFDKALTYIKREGIKELVKWLEDETDFFTAPASTNFHGNYEGGLLAHSMNVTRFALHNLNFMIKQKPELEDLRESVVICGLFHDICKTNTYFLDKKWTKDEDGKWKDYIGYKVKDSFPIGHGEKSLYLISKYVRLTDAEAMAIRWHMGATEISTMLGNTAQNYAYSEAVNEPLVRLIISADMLAVSIEEQKDYKNS